MVYNLDDEATILGIADTIEPTSLLMCVDEVGHASGPGIQRLIIRYPEIRGVILSEPTYKRLGHFNLALLPNTATTTYILYVYEVVSAIKKNLKTYAFIEALEKIVLIHREFKLSNNFYLIEPVFRTDEESDYFYSILDEFSVHMDINVFIVNSN